jgi:hypothetical protein
MIAGNSTALNSVAGTPSLLSGSVPFDGQLLGAPDGSTVIYVDIQNNNQHGVVGFIGHLGPFATVSNITLRGSVQGNSIVGGLVGWNQSASSISHNNVSELTVINTSTFRPITGQLIGVVSNPPDTPWLTRNYCCYTCIYVQWPQLCCGYPQIGYQSGYGVSVRAFTFQFKEPEENDTQPTELNEGDDPLPDENIPIEDGFDFDNHGRLRRM